MKSVYLLSCTNPSCVYVNAHFLIYLFHHPNSVMSDFHQLFLLSLIKYEFKIRVTYLKNKKKGKKTTVMYAYIRIHVQYEIITPTSLSFSNTLKFFVNMLKLHFFISNLYCLCWLLFIYI